MRFLRSTLVSLLSFLLFLSLSVFGTVYMLNQTVLDRNFVNTELEQLDIAGILKGTLTQQYGEQIGLQLSQQLTQQLGQPVPPLGSRITAAMDATITDLDPWLKQQMKDVTNSFSDYMTGRSQTLNLRIPLATVKDALKKNLQTAVVQAPELAAAPAQVKQAAADSVAQSLVTQLPDTFDLNQLLGPDALKTLAQVRQYTGYVPLAYWGLIVLMVLLVLGIIFIGGNIKGATRSLGTTFLGYAVFGYAIGWAIDSFLGGFSIPGLPDTAQKAMSGLLSGFSSPMQTFSILLGVVGLVLIVVSFIIKSKPAQPAAVAPAKEESAT